MVDMTQSISVYVCYDRSFKYLYNEEKKMHKSRRILFTISKDKDLFLSWSTDAIENS